MSTHLHLGLASDKNKVYPLDDCQHATYRLQGSVTALPLADTLKPTQTMPDLFIAQMKYNVASHIKFPFPVKIQIIFSKTDI
jgi:hypothetical protein